MTLHVIRPRRNTHFSEHGSFSVAPAEIQETNIVRRLSTISLLISLSLNSSRVYMIKERCWFSPIDFFVEYFPHRINVCFFPANLMSSTYTDKNNPFRFGTKDIPNLEFSPSHVSIGFSQIAFYTTVLPKNDHTDFVQEERLGLQYWTMILAICVVVDESKCLDIPILK